MTARIARGAAIALALPLLVAACTDDNPPDAVAAQPSSTVAPGATPTSPYKPDYTFADIPDVCTILTPADLTAVFGGTARGDQLGHRCDWKIELAAGRTLTMWVLTTNDLGR